MLVQNIKRQETDTVTNDELSNKTTDTSLYIADLLGELQTIAKVGGLSSLSDEIELVLVKPMSGPSIL